MKKSSRMQRLVLARETVRKLADADLAGVKGALKQWTTRPLDPTYADGCTWGGGSICWLVD